MSGPLGVRAVATRAAIVGLAVLLNGCTHRYYTLSPIEGITYIDVFDNSGSPSGRITDRTQVDRIVAFVNTLRDRWYDPQGAMFATTGEIHLHGPSNWVDIAFGPGGMFLTRKGMTYTDSVKTQDFIVIRTEDWHGRRDDAALCRLLGPRFRNSCVFQGQETPRTPPGTLPPECRCDRDQLRPNPHVSASPA